jgi:hypothetical protein
MEILVNELSLSGQYSTVEDFFHVGLIPFMKVLKNIDGLPIEVYQRCDFNQAQATQRDTIHQILTREEFRRCVEVQRYKVLLDRLFTGPYWDLNSKQSTNSTYRYNENNVCGSSLAEACERDKAVISFYHDDFKSHRLSIFRDECEIGIDNLIEDEKFIQLAYEWGIMPFSEYCRRKFKGSNLCFDDIDQKDGFILVKSKEEEHLLLKEFDMFSKLTWEDMRANYRLGYRKYDYDRKNKHFKNTNEDIDYFKLSGKDRCYGYRKGNVFFVLGFDFEHKKSDGQ